VVKVTLGVVGEGGRILERDVVGLVNIEFRYLHPEGSLMALGLKGTHEVCEACEPTQRCNSANST